MGRRRNENTKLNSEMARPTPATAIRAIAGRQDARRALFALMTAVVRGESGLTYGFVLLNCCSWGLASIKRQGPCR